MKRFHIARLFFFPLILLIGCQNNSFKVDVSEVALPQMNIKDYGTALFSLDRSNLNEGLSGIQEDYTLFLGTESLSNEQVIQLSQYVNDPFLIDLYNSYKIEFTNLKPIEGGMSKAFRYLLCYYPNTKVPEVFSYISGVQEPIVFRDNVLVLGLDNYLGSESEVYARLGVPRYKMSTMNREYIVRDIISALSFDKIPAPNSDGTLLEHMIFEGKKLFFIKSMIPDIEDSVLMKFSEKQLSWYSSKEEDLWKHYIENELLFKSDFESLKKYINEAPFTSVLGNDSPPRTGIWLGYRIILSYAKSQKLSLNEILQNENAQEILNQSKYRPGR